MPRKISKTVRNIAFAVVIPVVVLAAGGGGLYTYNEWTGNIHVVDAGQVYRSALYRLSQGADASVASQALSLRFGHFPYFWNKTVAMDESFKLYVENVSATRPMNFSTSTPIEAH